MPLSTIGSNQITDGAIAVADVADGSITTAKIADDAVTSAKVDTNIAISGTLDVAGAFTSQGIDDNANATAIAIDSNEDITITKQGFNTTNIRFANSSGSFGGNIKYDHNVGNMIFEVHNGERIRFRSDGGICFNGDTSADNALDDYEQGTFTPTAGDGNTTYNTQHGFYTKIGEMVHAQFNIAINSFGGSTRFAMGGLPFTSKNTSGSSGIGTITYFNSIHTSAVMLSARNDANTSAVYISGTTGNGGTMANINHNVFQNGTNVFGAIIYRAS